MIEHLPQTVHAWFLGLLREIGAPGWAVDVASALVIVGVLLGFFLALFALTSLVERKILARIQNRFGPNRVGPGGLLQPVADGIKMLTKEDIVPAAADRVVHFLAPVVAVVPAIVALAILPYGRGLTPVSLDAGILLYFAVSTAAEIAIFMAGWAGASKYALLGAMRALAQMMGYELPLILSAVCAAMISGSLMPEAIVAAQQGWTAGVIPHWFVFTPWGFAAFVVFFIAALAESNRSPFDLPEGESELVAGHLTEYSGFKYALFFMAEYIGAFAICGLGATLFLGGWLAPCAFLQWIPSWVWFPVKLYALMVLMIWVRGTVPRVRIDQLLGFAWKFLLPMAFAALIAAAVWHHAGRGWAAWIASGVLVAVPYLLFARAHGRQFAPRNYYPAEECP
jgi:NADH-quinone oxidoreductase subunit H